MGGRAHFARRCRRPTFSSTTSWFPGDPQIDYLTSPFYSTEFQDKANLALTWNFQKFSTTVYGEYYGNTPNYQATLDVSGYAQPGAGKLGAWSSPTGARATRS